MRTNVGSCEVDDDPARVDVPAAVEFLVTEAYWATWRDAETIARQIREAWRVVGAYDAAGAMVGFARAFGDGTSYYLTDVYVLPSHRGTGLGKAIMRAMIDDGPGADSRWMLHTTDAHGLYQQFGFADPDSRYLERPGRPDLATMRGLGRATRPQIERSADRKSNTIMPQIESQD